MIENAADEFDDDLGRDLEAPVVVGDEGDLALEEAMTAVDFASLSEAQVRDLESGDRDKIARALMSEPGPGDETPGGAEAEAEAVAVGGDGAPTRISLKAISDPEERRALAEATRMVRDGKYPNLKSALVEMLGLNQGAAAEGDLNPSLELGAEGIENRIAELQEQRQAAKEEFDYDVADRLLEEISELRLDLREAQRAEESHAELMRDWVKVEESSRELARELYPELRDPNSFLYQAMEDELILADYRKDAIFSSPDWPEKIATKVYEKHGGKFGGGYAEPDESGVARKIPNPPSKGVRMPGSPVGPAANTAVVTAQVAMAQLARLSLEEQDAVLAMLDINEQVRARRKES